MVALYLLLRRSQWFTVFRIGCIFTKKFQGLFSISDPTVSQGWVLVNQTMTRTRIQPEYEDWKLGWSARCCPTAGLARISLMKSWGAACGWNQVSIARFDEARWHFGNRWSLARGFCAGFSCDLLHRKSDFNIEVLPFPQNRTFGATQSLLQCSNPAVTAQSRGQCINKWAWESASKILF